MASGQAPPRAQAAIQKAIESLAKPEFLPAVADALNACAAAGPEVGTGIFNAFWSHVQSSRKAGRHVADKERAALLRYLLAAAGGMGLLHPSDPAVRPGQRDQAPPPDTSFLDNWHTFTLASLPSNRRSLRAALHRFVPMLMLHDTNFAGALLAERFHSVGRGGGGGGGVPRRPPSASDSLDTALGLSLLPPGLAGQGLPGSGSPLPPPSALRHPPPASMPDTGGGGLEAAAAHTLVQQLLQPASAGVNDSFLSILRRYGGQRPGQLMQLLSKYLRSSTTRYAALGVLFRLLTGRPTGLELALTLGPPALPHLISALHSSTAAVAEGVLAAAGVDVLSTGGSSASGLRGGEGGAGAGSRGQRLPSDDSALPTRRPHRWRQASEPPVPSKALLQGLRQAAGGGGGGAGAAPSTDPPSTPPLSSPPTVTSFSAGIRALVAEPTAALGVPQYHLSCTALAVWVLVILAPACLPALTPHAPPFTRAITRAGALTAVLMSYSGPGSRTPPRQPTEGGAEPGSEEGYPSLGELQAGLAHLGMHDACVVLLGTAFAAFPHTTLPVLQTAVHDLRGEVGAGATAPPSPAADAFILWCAKGLAPVAGSAVATLLDTDAFEEGSASRWTFVDQGKWYLDLLHSLTWGQVQVERQGKGGRRSKTVYSDSSGGEGEVAAPVVAPAAEQGAEGGDTFHGDAGHGERQEARVAAVGGGSTDAESIAVSVEAADALEGDPLRAQWNRFLMASHVKVRNVVTATLRKYLSTEQREQPQGRAEDAAASTPLEEVFYPPGLPRNNVPLLMHELAFERHLRQLQTRRTRAVQEEATRLATSAQSLAAMQHRVEQLTRECAALRAQVQERDEELANARAGAAATAAALADAESKAFEPAAEPEPALPSPILPIEPPSAPTAADSAAGDDGELSRLRAEVGMLRTALQDARGDLARWAEYEHVVLSPLKAFAAENGLVIKDLAPGVPPGAASPAWAGGDRARRGSDIGLAGTPASSSGGSRRAGMSTSSVALQTPGREGSVGTSTPASAAERMLKGLGRMGGFLG